nr:hypothetical protein [uncultured Sellimonas sp.]
MDGFTYVPVMAQKTFSAPRNGSDIEEGASTSSGYYIHWGDGGFTNKHGWDALKPELQHTGWPALAAEHGVAPDWTNFELYISGQLPEIPFPGNLNNVLGDDNWSKGSKNGFVDTNVWKLGINGLVAENDPYKDYFRVDGCIESLSY